MIDGCEDRSLRLWDIQELLSAISSAASSMLYLGVDVARKHDLCVLDVGEKIGDVVWDRLRLELANKSFSEIKSELYRLLRLSQVKRCCIDATGLGMQLAEEARRDFGWKLEPISFTAPIKEQLAFGLRKDLEERKLRLVCDDRLRADLRGIKKEVTSSGNIRFAGETSDSHCDRFWAKALRQHATRGEEEVWAMVA
jgi:phage FluMu gp28-like protein